MQQLLTADEVARVLAVKRGFVYRHKEELGAVRLGKRIIRFNADVVRRAAEKGMEASG